MNFLRWLPILSLSFCVQVYAHNALLPKLFHSLSRAFEFALNNEIKNLNYLFGVAVSKGQLSLAKTYLDLKSGERGVVERLECLADALLRNLPPEDNPLAKSASPELWTVDFPPQYIRLDGVANIGQMKTLSLEDEGHPTAEESNHCIGLLLANCTAPTECVHIETSDNSSGYALTHQTLYFQIARAMGCNEHGVDYSAIIEEKCQRIYLEHTRIVALGLPTHLQDLFLEQVVVCGIEGIGNFLTPFTLGVALDLQKNCGCFAVKELTGKQTSFENCSLHLSGVSTAALTIFIKAILRNNF